MPSLFWSFLYYLFFNIVFLIPMGILIFSIELWLVYRAAYIKTYENRSFLQAAGGSINEFFLVIKIIFKP